MTWYEAWLSERWRRALWVLALVAALALMLGLCLYVRSLSLQEPAETEER